MGSEARDATPAQDAHPARHGGPPNARACTPRRRVTRTFFSDEPRHGA